MKKKMLFILLIISSTVLVGCSDFKAVSITYDYNGGGVNRTELVAIGEYVSEPNDIPQKSGYRFDGWYLGTQLVYSLKATEDITLVAHFTRVYNIDFDTVGGTGSFVMLPKTAGSTVTISSDKPEKDGYIFEGWLFNGNVYQPNSTLTINDSNVLLIAQWTAKPQAKAPVSINRVYGDNRFYITDHPDNYNLSSATMHYTIDGTDPTESDPSGNIIKIDSNTTVLRVRVFSSSANPSEVKSFPVTHMPGYVFYDCDQDNSNTVNDGLESDVCGWRYLLAAYDDITTPMIFGYYRDSPNGHNKFANGKESISTNIDPDSVHIEVGYGYENTQKFIATIGNGAYSEDEGSEWTTNTALNAALSYSVGGYSNWFLPTKGDMDAMQKNLYNRFSHRGGLVYGKQYWTSTEQLSGGECLKAICQSPKLAHWQSKVMPGGLFDKSFALARVKPVMRFKD